MLKEGRMAPVLEAQLVELGERPRHALIVSRNQSDLSGDGDSRSGQTKEKKDLDKVVVAGNGGTEKRDESRESDGRIHQQDEAHDDRGSNKEGRSKRISERKPYIRPTSRLDGKVGLVRPSTAPAVMAPIAAAPLIDKASTTMIRTTPTPSSPQAPNTVFVLLVSTLTPATTVVTTIMSHATTVTISGRPDPTSDYRSSQSQPTATGGGFVFSPNLAPIPIPTALAETKPLPTVGHGADSDPRHVDEHHDDRGLDPLSEHLLIAFGSIGGFILICFVSWLVWRAMKMSDMTGSAGGRRRSRAFSMLPDRFAGRVLFPRQRQWQNLDDHPVPSAFREPFTSSGPMAEYYGRDSKTDLQQQAQPQPIYQPQHRANMSISSHPQVLGLAIPESLRRQASFVRSEPPIRGSLSNPTVGPLSTMTVPIVFHSPYSSHQPKPSFGSGRTEVYGVSLAADHTGTGTMRSFVPGPFLNQSELARQPSEGHDPSRHKVNRVSDLSSISSGFGDGDIIVPEQFIIPPPPAHTTDDEWTKPGSMRDTVYTQTSEDLPPRFRSVTSWVNQQSGRVKRAQQRSDGEEDKPPVPQLPGQIGVLGVHNPPAEPTFAMMMYDGEEPRRVDDALAGRMAGE